MTVYDMFMDRINKVWNENPSKVDWLRMEEMQVEILRSKLRSVEKVNLLQQCIDAFTRRGHFCSVTK